MPEPEMVVAENPLYREVFDLFDKVTGFINAFVQPPMQRRQLL